MPGAGIGVTGGGAGALAATGADSGWWLAIGALLVALAVIALIAFLRRRGRFSRVRG